MVIHLILGIDGEHIIDYLPLEALTTANASNAPRQALFSFMAGFLSSPKRVVQVVSIQTSSTGFNGHVAFDVRKQGSGGFTYDIASNGIQRILPVVLRQLVYHLPDGAAKTPVRAARCRSCGSFVGISDSSLQPACYV